MGDLKELRHRKSGIKTIKIREKSSTLEDLLATDDLFIEYFNAFLALPSFPEPLQFNKESGGFEIVSNAKKRLAAEIKAAVRSTRRRKRIYRPVHHHSYSTIPLVPMEDPEEENESEIDTSFTIKSLNKEQGVEWIKKERMPAFLESDIYGEYRLAKLISQAEAAYKPNEYVSIKIDYRPRRTEEKIVEVEIPEEDKTEALMRNMFVCMGNASTTDTDAWVSQAKTALATTTSVTTSSKTRPTSAVVASTKPHLHSGRPYSAADTTRSKPMSAISEDDSGIWSPTKSSLRDVSDYPSTATSENDVTSNDSAAFVSRLFGADCKPVTPRPSDLVCVIAEKQEGDKQGGVVYSVPRLPTPPPDEKDDDASTISDEIDGTPAVEDKHIMVNSVEQVGSIIVGTALKQAMSTVFHLSISEVESHPDLKSILPQSDYPSLNVDDINKSEFLICDDSQSQGNRSRKSSVEVPEIEIPTEQEEKSLIALGKDENESDNDSLLNSDDDYEEGRDDFFHKKKEKVYSLCSKKGLAKFRAFLEGTIGEKNWNLWLDIERAKLIKDEEEKANYLLAMRERYQKPGGVYELSTESKLELGLTIPTSWTLDRLTTVHSKIAEPLILYWAPRFMIKQHIHVNPDKHYLYHHQKLMKVSGDASYPNPPVTPLLPLRPKTCVPKTQLQTKPEIVDLFPCEDAGDAIPITAPPVGNKRVYDLPDMFAPFNTKRDKDTQNKKKKSYNEKKKTPKQLITSKMSGKTDRGSRPSSAPGGRSQSRARDTWKDSPRAHRAWGSNTSLNSSLFTPRPGSATQSRRSSMSVISMTSEFLGGRRMEGLLQALASEQHSGSFFRKHVDKCGNKLWKNCLDFWLQLQAYHQLFYSELLDPFKLSKQAMYLYSNFIVVGAPFSIDCTKSIQDKVFKQLDPPYEELFDDAEEYVLNELYEAWTHSLSEDISTFDKVELIEVKRHLDTKSRYVVSLQKRGIIKERAETPEDSLEGYQDPTYDETLWERIPDEYKEFSLEKLVHNRLELEHFRQFLAENYASMDLMCWMDIEAFRRIPHTEDKRRDLKAKDCKVKYFNKKYFFGPNSPAGREGQEKVMAAGGGWGKLLDDRPPTVCLLEAQKYVRERLEKKWLPLFLATESFSDRQRPRSGMGDVVEDVMIQRKKKSQAIWKMLESKWVSSSKDILTFRKALSNPVTSFHFRRFLSAKSNGEQFFENDVLFWQEVQRYKDLCHIHSDRSLIQTKTAAIINCFIDSPIPPSLQVDITQDMAEKILDRKLEATPYLFREAQLTVFRILFTKWQEFCNFRSNLAEDKILPTLERLRKKNMIEEKKKRREMEEKKEKELTRRRELGLPLDGVEDEDQTDTMNLLDPFERTGSVASEGSGHVDSKDNVRWSYSQYIHALDHEEVLNDVDESTFSSLTLDTNAADVPDDMSEVGDRESRPSSASGRRLKKEVKKTKEEDNDVENSGKPIKIPRAKVEMSDSGSQTDVKMKKGPHQVQFPKLSVTDAKSQSSGDSGVQRSTERIKSAKTRTAPNPVQPRMARGMPPLVGKR